MRGDWLCINTVLTFNSDEEGEIKDSCKTAAYCVTQIQNQHIHKGCRVHYGPLQIFNLTQDYTNGQQIYNKGGEKHMPLFESIFSECTQNYCMTIEDLECISHMDHFYNTFFGGSQCIEFHYLEKSSVNSLLSFSICVFLH